MSATAGRSFADPLGGPTITRDHHGTDVVAMEREAIRVLERVPDARWDVQAPIPIDWIVGEMYDLRVQLHDNIASVVGVELPEGKRLSGLLLEDRGLILVDSWEVEQWPNRRRFTIAHELGHFLLHRKNPEYLASPGASGLPLIEAEAHAFAAALLMPAALLRPAADACNGDWSQLLEPFLTTNGAVERRLRTLGYEVKEKN
jgi:hypothetical protein